MTREEKLYSMTMTCLVEVANRLGIKIDKKGAKSKAVAKILEAEAKQADEMKVDESKLVPMPGVEKLADVDKEVKKIQDKRKAEKKQKAKKEITNPEDISDTEYVAEVMEQKKELGIECPPIEKVEIVKADKPAKKTRVKKSSEEVKDSFGEVLRVLDSNKRYTYTTGKSNIVIYSKDEKVAVVYKRKYKVRFYVAPDTFSKIQKFSDLYEGQGVGDYRVFKVSLFVKTENVETAFNKMFS